MGGLHLNPRTLRLLLASLLLTAAGRMIAASL
jgi:IS1 family transposase